MACHQQTDVILASRRDVIHLLRDTMLAGLLPEDELCLLLARGQLLPGERARVLQVLAGPLNWAQILKRADDHQVLPLLYRSLMKLEFHGVPSEVRTRLTAEFRQNAIRNMLFVAELAREMTLLGEAGIRVIPLKGVTLAEALYGDPACRICSDIDILVPAADALRARNLILNDGYVSPFTEDFFAHHQFHTSADCPMKAQRGEIPYFMELHWTLLQHSSHDAEAMQDIWAEARPRNFFGVEAYSLTPEWEFLYLACHASNHKWHTLKWIADIHDLCASISIDWESVRSKAARFDLEFVAESTLAVCSRLYGTPLPASYSNARLPPDVQLYPHSLDPSEAWDAPLFYGRLLKRPTEKLRWFAEMFFVARQSDQMAFHLPASLDFLYFVLRPLRLTAKWSGLFLSAGFHKLRQLFSTSPK